jgi:tight adherence protein D
VIIKFAKLVLLLAGTIMLQACATKGSDQVPMSAMSSSGLNKQETVLTAAKNTRGLIRFYRQQLRRHDSSVYRQKLAKTYLKTQDPESALFTLRPLLNQNKMAIETRVTAGKAYMDLGRMTEAKRLLQPAYTQVAENGKTKGEIANLLGIIDAGAGDYHQARNMFLVARSHFYDDTSVKNNLALLDMLEGYPEQALSRLETLQSEIEKDPQLHANLLLAMAKSGQAGALAAQLGDGFSEQQAQMIYQALRHAQVIRQDKAVHPSVQKEKQHGQPRASL